jgi:DedD protein
MAERLGDEELRLRQRARRRLIGAVAVAVMLVVFLPMLLDKEPKKTGENLLLAIPAREGIPFNPDVPAAGSQPAGRSAEARTHGIQGRSTTVTDRASGTPSESPEHAAEPGVPTGKPASPVEPAAAPAADPAVAPEKPSAIGTADSSVKKESYVVQVGVFSDRHKAKQLQGRLTRNNIKSYSDTLPGEHGAKTRVRCGPFASRAEAEKVYARLKLMGESAQVMRL